MPVPIYTFGLGEPAEETSPEVIGGKAASLFWMTSMGLHVPPGFVIPTTVWQQYRENPEATMAEIKMALAVPLAKLANYFGYMPLLSVRSGARVSCPGMMDTILNVGLDLHNCEWWRDKLGDQCYLDSLRRLVKEYGRLVHELDTTDFIGDDPATALADVLLAYPELTGYEFPNAADQILGAIETVFKSWDNDRAKVYRSMHGIPDEWGTAVTVQAMVFGNLNDKSCTGVCFSRDCSSGANLFVGEFIVGAQGEDIVAGTHTPRSIIEMIDWEPETFQLLRQQVKGLESAKREVQDVEFTVQDGTLYFLQCRNAKRTSLANILFNLDFLKEETITRAEFWQRVNISDIDRAKMPMVINPPAPTYTGISASVGVAQGLLITNREKALKTQEPFIYVADETTPDDLEIMARAQGVITRKGGFTSHAAVNCRGMNKPCITAVNIPSKIGTDIHGTMDGATGSVWLGELKLQVESPQVACILTGMVQDEIGGGLVICDVPEQSLTSAVFDIYAKLRTPEDTAAVVKETLTKVDRLYLEMGTPNTEQQRFFALSGFSRDNTLKALDATLTDAEAKRVSVVGFTSQQYEMFPRFDYVGDVSNLEEVVMAEKKVALSYGKEISNQKAIDKVLGWKMKEGIEFLHIGHVPKDGVGYLSPETALQKLMH